MPLITPTPADFRPSAGTKSSSGTAGAAIDMFDLLFKDANDGNKWKLAINTALESCAELAIATSFADADKTVLLVKPGGYIESDVPLWTAGETYVVSSTGGQMFLAGDLAAGQYLTLCGFAETTQKFLFKEIATGIQK